MYPFIMYDCMYVVYVYVCVFILFIVLKQYMFYHGLHNEYAFIDYIFHHDCSSLFHYFFS